MVCWFVVPGTVGSIDAFRKPTSEHAIGFQQRRSGHEAHPAPKAHAALAERRLRESTGDLSVRADLSLLGPLGLGSCAGVRRPPCGWRKLPAPPVPEQLAK